MNRFKYILITFLIFSTLVTAQKDTLFLKNKDVLAGTVENFSAGVLSFSTDYSDEDFKIEFDKINGIYIHKRSIITLTRSRRRYGTIKTMVPGTISITTGKDIVETFKIRELISLQEVNEDRKKRISGSIDLGYDFTKAQGKSQITLDGKLAYLGELWVSNASINLLQSRQDEVEDIKRIDAKTDLRRLLSRTWYLIGELTFLSNTEQTLEGRFTPNIGVGKLLASTHRLYFGVSIGLAFNNENYVDHSLNKNSVESFIAGNLNMYNFDDIDLITDIKVSPSLSEIGRIRTDYSITLKYDLPYDFYIKTGFTVNYDNQPAIEGNEIDYVFSSGFGWEFN